MTSEQIAKVLCSLGKRKVYFQHGDKVEIVKGINVTNDNVILISELKYSTPTLEDYIEALPYFTFKNGKLETTDNDWAYIPTLYKFEGTWAIDWIDAEESDSIEVIKGTTPTEAAKNAYAWCVKEGYIKDTLNNK